MPELTTTDPAPFDAPAASRALDVFNALVREVDAGRALIVLATPGDERRRAALDSLALARDVLADAAELLEAGQ